MSENQAEALRKAQTNLAGVRASLDAMTAVHDVRQARAARLSPAALGDRRLLARNRLYANLMALWRHCPKASCYRAGCCRGLPSLCVARHAARVPARVHEAATLMLHAMAEGVSPAALRRAQPKLMIELDDWNNAAARRCKMSSCSGLGGAFVVASAMASVDGRASRHAGLRQRPRPVAASPNP
jgi:hypothetical protein